MAIQFDTAVGSGSTAGSFTTFSLTVPVADNPNRLLVVSIATEGTSAASASSVTYNGVSLTQIGKLDIGGTAANTGEMWYILAPAVGTNWLDVTFQTTVTAGAVVGATSLYNVKQQAPEAVVSQSWFGTTGFSVTASIATVTNNAIIVEGISHAQSTNTFEPGGGQTERYDVTATGALRAAGGTEIVAVAGTEAQSWSYTLQLSAAQGIGYFLAAFEAEPEPTGSTSARSYGYIIL